MIAFLVGLAMSILAMLTVVQVRREIVTSFNGLRETRDLERHLISASTHLVDLELMFRGYLMLKSEDVLKALPGTRKALADDLVALGQTAELESGLQGAVSRFRLIADQTASSISTGIDTARTGSGRPGEVYTQPLEVMQQIFEAKQEKTSLKSLIDEKITQRRNEIDHVIGLLLASVLILLAGIAVSSIALLREFRRQRAIEAHNSALTANTISTLTTNLDLSRRETEQVNQRLALAIQSAGAAVFTLGRDGKIKWLMASSKSPMARGERDGNLKSHISPLFRPIFAHKLEQAFESETPIIFDLAMQTGPPETSAGERWLRFNVLPAGLDGDLVLGSAIDITDIRRRENANRLLMRELSHRSKNLLAIVQAMARQTARAANSLSSFQERFSHRLRALAASHDLLVLNNYSGAQVKDIILSQLADLAHHVGARIILEGRDLFMQPEAAQTFGMAIHELASNARLFGALSNDIGKVAIRWHDGIHDGKPVFIVEWIESDGPHRDSVPRRGFGTTLISVSLPRALNGQVELVHEPGGTRCVMTLDRALIVSETAVSPLPAEA